VKVYLETSFFSACVSTRQDARSISWRETSIEWWQTQARHYDLYVSDEVVAELSEPAFKNREAALAMLRGLTLLELTPEVRGLADILVKEKVMPAPSVSGDALHVAAAVIHGIDYILSWNVKHLANPNKRSHMGMICLRLGLIPPQIVTPDILQEAS
jgi:predicted nucleic acid-binding protein